ncbi:MAG: hypothetical protein ACKPKO_15670, partial [Candidatus Fonsibacter sp.]
NSCDSCGDCLTYTRSHGKIDCNLTAQRVCNNEAHHLGNAILQYGRVEQIELSHLIHINDGMVLVRAIHRSNHRYHDHRQEAAVHIQRDALTVDMIVEVTRRASQAHIRRCFTM